MAWARFRRPPTALLLILTVAAVLRVGVALYTGPAWFPLDTVTYLEQGKGILTGAPYAFFPNGFPLLIAALWAAVGPAAVPEAIVAVNVIFSVATVGLSYAIGREVAGRDVGLLAALVVAVFPNQINYARFIMSEVLAGVLLAASVYLLLRHRALWSGFVLGLAVLVRTSLLPALALLLGTILVFRRGLKEAGAFLLGAALVAGLHAALLTTGTIAPTQNSDYNLLIALTATSTQGIDFSRSRFEARFTDEERAHPLATYVRFAAEHPKEYAKQRLSSLWELWGPWPAPGSSEHPRRLWARLLIGLRFLVIVPAAWALLRHRRDERAWILAGPILTITLVHTAFFSTPRFTYVVEPLAIVLVAWLAVGLWRERLKPHKPSLE